MTLAPLLRSRMALFAMLGIFLLPVAFSSLRGLTHVLHCEEEADIPFTLTIPREEPPTIATSKTILRGAPEGPCEGLVLDLRARELGAAGVEMLVAITNGSRSTWQGSVALDLGASRVPVGIGAVPAGSTRIESLRLSLDPGLHEVEGTLFVGP